MQHTSPTGRTAVAGITEHSPRAMMALIANWQGVMTAQSPAMMRKILTDKDSFVSLEKRIIATHGEDGLEEMNSAAFRASITSMSPQAAILERIWRDRMQAETLAYTPPPGPWGLYPPSEKGRMRPLIAGIFYAWYYMTGTRKWESAGPNIRLYTKI